MRRRARRMARCLCIRRISLGEMYQRFRRASLRIRSFMTCFLKRFSKASCDSPSLKLTVAKALTSLQPTHLNSPAPRTGHRKPGSLTHLLDGSRADTDLAVGLASWLSPGLLSTRWPQFSAASARDARSSKAGTATPQALVQSTWCLSSSTEAGATIPAACQLAPAVHPGTGNVRIIPEIPAGVKAGRYSRRRAQGGGLRPQTQPIALRHRDKNSAEASD